MVIHAPGLLLMYLVIYFCVQTRARRFSAAFRGKPIVRN
jgi:hypothetical protein